MDWNPADAVAAARRIRGRMTQPQLAERLTEVTGVRWTRDMVASLENGRKTFDVDVLMAVTEALDVSTSFILFGKEPAGREKMGFAPSVLGLLAHPVPVAA